MRRLEAREELARAAALGDPFTVHDAAKRFVDRANRATAAADALERYADELTADYRTMARALVAVARADEQHHRQLATPLLEGAIAGFERESSTFSALSYTRLVSPTSCSCSCST